MLDKTRPLNLDILNSGESKSPSHNVDTGDQS